MQTQNQTTQEIKQGKTFWLDWNEHTLYVYELKKSRQTVESILRGIELGSDFPAVPVDRVGENKFTLTHVVDEKDIQVGGHNRAFAHYLAGKPLKCVLLNDACLLGNSYPQVSDIQLTDDKFDYLGRKEHYGGYE